MTHYLLLKFSPGAYTQEIRALTQRTFHGLKEALDCVREVCVLENVVPRDCNADLLVRMELTGPEALSAYLEHPLHRAFAQQTMPIISQRVTFDH